MNRILALLFAFVVFASVAKADFNSTPYNDLMLRSFTERVIVDSPIISNAADLSVGTLLADFDIATSPSVTLTSDNFDAIHAGVRTIAFEIGENAGNDINGTVTVEGVNQWGQGVTEVITFEAGDTFAITRNAFAVISSITLDLRDTAASDLLNASPAGFGFQSHATASGIRQVNLKDGAATYTRVTSYTWNPTYSTITAFGPTLSEGDEIELIGFQNNFTRPTGAPTKTSAE